MKLKGAWLVVGMCGLVSGCGDDPVSGGGGTGGEGSQGGAGGAHATGGMGGAPSAGGSSTGGGDTGGAASIGPYIDCKMETIPCPTAGAICPNDSTGSVCAPPCETAADCPALGGALNGPDCYEVPLGKFCIIPCSFPDDCPEGMQCLSLGLGAQCGWE